MCKNTIIFLVLCITAVAAMEPARIQGASRRSAARTVISRHGVRRLKDKTNTTTVKSPGAPPSTKEPPATKPPKDPFTEPKPAPTKAPKSPASMVPKPSPTKAPKSPTTKVPAQTKPPVTTKPPKTQPPTASSSKKPTASSSKVPQPETVEMFAQPMEPLDDSNAAPEPAVPAPAVPAPTAAPNTSATNPAPAESSAATNYFGVAATMVYCVAISFSLW